MNDAQKRIRRYPKKRIKNQEQLEFVIVYIEKIAQETKKSGKTVLKELDDCQILSRYFPLALENDMYCAQKPEYIVNDILGFARELEADL